MRGRGYGGYTDEELRRELINAGFDACRAAMLECARRFCTQDAVQPIARARADGYEAGYVDGRIAEGRARDRK